MIVFYWFFPIPNYQRTGNAAGTTDPEHRDHDGHLRGRRVRADQPGQR